MSSNGCQWIYGKDETRKSQDEPFTPLVSRSLTGVLYETVLSSPGLL